MTLPIAPRAAVFFDRDGVLNVDRGYVHAPEQFAWIDGAIDAVRACNESGLLVFVVTNQAGVAHGYYPESDVTRLHAWMSAALHAQGAHVDEFAYCPHHPQARLDAYRQSCACRKPAAGMILSLCTRWPIDLASSFLVGDKDTDLAAAEAAGLPGFLYRGGSLDEFVATCRAALPVRATASS